MPAEPIRHRWSRENLRPASWGPVRLSFPSLRDPRTGELDERPFDGDYGEEIERLIREWAGPQRGRPSKLNEHREWADAFERLRDELNGDFHPVDGERSFSKIKIAQSVVDELGLDVTARAVWDAVKPLLDR